MERTIRSVLHYIPVTISVLIARSLRCVPGLVVFGAMLVAAMAATAVAILFAIYVLLGVAKILINILYYAWIFGSSSGGITSSFCHSFCHLW